ncbi:hypothetical protein [Sphingomonas sp. ERG5]|uniref:hypothetical protein n=1 Tax=Sphingomonas sp. ERG5 TaxID=1381597 RepID=UPI001269C055|nr:hypothetical protein [Sphingomonas sp. ERG5]
MNRFIGICATALIAAASPAAAQQTWSPAGQSGTLSGPLSMTYMGTYACNPTFTLTISADGKTATATPPPGCLYSVFTNGPYPVAANSPTSVTIKNITWVSPMVGCSGDLTGTFDSATSTISFNMAAVPAYMSPGAPPCKISGRLKATPGISFTIP